MKPEEPSTLIFTRHGRTKYTDQFPDLTDEGKQDIENAAAKIVKVIGGRKNIQIRSSPQARALGSADIIAKALGYAPANIMQEPAIRRMDIYDVEKANVVWASFPSARDVDRAYANGDEQFDSGLIVEKRCSVQRRFYGYLGDLFTQFVEGKLPEAVIHSGHFEVFYDLAAMFGFDEPLSHGEPIVLDLNEFDTDDGVVLVKGMFREKTMEIECPLPSTMMRWHLHTALAANC